MDFTSKYDIDDIVFAKVLFHKLLPFRVVEINHKYYKNNQDVMELTLHYTISNRQAGLTEKYIDEKFLYKTEAQAVAHYMGSK